MKHQIIGYFENAQIWYNNRWLPMGKARPGIRTTVLWSNGHKDHKHKYWIL